MNYASALLAGAKFSKPGAKVKLSDWLPYNLEEPEADTPTISIELAAEIGRLSLPPAMARDLLKLNLITPPKN